MRILLLSIFLQLLSFYFYNSELKAVSREDGYTQIENAEEMEVDMTDYLRENRYEHMLVLIPKSEDLQELSPILGKDFLGFKEALAYRESSGDYFTVNEFGYIGKYQFGEAAMRDLGIENKDAFLMSPELQERAFVAFCSLNKYKLRNYIYSYHEKVVGGVRLTESGMLAAAHLVGPGAVLDFIKSNGEIKASDGIGTNIIEYLETFSDYDISVITPVKNVSIKAS